MVLLATVAASLLWGAMATWTAVRQVSAANDIVSGSGQLSYDAQQVYQLLSNADATEANAYLQSPVKPAAAIALIHDDTVRAEAYLAAIAMAGPGPATRADVTTLVTRIPDYANLLGWADANNRFGELVGAAYLREASSLMRGTLLVAASDLYAKENARLAASDGQSTGFPVPATAAILCAAVLLWAQRQLARRTRRLLNPGLVAASLAGLVSLGWLLGSYAIARSDLLAAADHGSASGQALVHAEITALRMHADESLTLINRDGPADPSEQEWERLQPLLARQLSAAEAAGTGSPGAGQATAATTDAQAWFGAHAAVRNADNRGTYTKAVALATGASTADYQRVESALTAGITADQHAFAGSAARGDDALGGIAAVMIAAGLLMAAACAWGVSRRLAEYR